MAADININMDSYYLDPINVHIIDSDQLKIGAGSIGDVSKEYVDEQDAILNAKIVTIASGDDAVTTSMVSAWTYGRIDSGTHVAAGNKFAYTTEIIAKNENESVSFDSTKFKACISYWKEDGTKRSSTWITSSPIKIWETTAAKDGATGYRFEVMKLDGTMVTDDEKAAILFSRGIENKLAKDIKSLSDDIKGVYISLDGNDTTGDGTKENPYKTFQKALTKSDVVFAKPGEYAQNISVDSPGRSKVKIGLWGIENYDTNTSKPYIKLASGYKCRIYDTNEVDISDVWVSGRNGHGIYFKNCESVNLLGCKATNCLTNSSCGFKFTDTNVTLTRCEASGNDLDGFNFHSHGTSVMMDCISHDNADDGVSHHDDCNGTIIGGEFYNNGKGGVSSPTYGAKVNIYDIYSHDNIYGIYSVSNADSGNCKAIFANCICENNTRFDICINGCDAIGYNCSYDTKSVTEGSTFAEKDSKTNLTAGDGIDITDNVISGDPISIINYPSKPNTTVIAKGTLEDVINAKVVSKYQGEENKDKVLAINAYGMVEPKVISNSSSEGSGNSVFLSVSPPNEEAGFDDDFNVYTILTYAISDLVGPATPKVNDVILTPSAAYKISTVSTRDVEVEQVY